MNAQDFFLLILSFPLQIVSVGTEVGHVEPGKKVINSSPCNFNFTSNSFFFLMLSDATFYILSK